MRSTAVNLQTPPCVPCQPAARTRSSRHLLPSADHDRTSCTESKAQLAERSFSVDHRRPRSIKRKCQSLPCRSHSVRTSVISVPSLHVVALCKDRPDRTAHRLGGPCASPAGSTDSSRSMPTRLHRCPSARDSQRACWLIVSMHQLEHRTAV